MANVDWKTWNKRNKNKRSQMEKKSRKGNGPPMWTFRMQYLKTQPGQELWMHFQKYKGETFTEFYSRFVEVYDDNGNSRKRNIMSNSHNGERDVPCVLWFYCVEDENESFFANQNFAASVVVMEDYHEIQKKSAKGSKYTTLVACGGKDRFGRPNCELCDNGVKKVYGERKYWSMWPSAKKDIEEQLDAISHRCGNCGTGELSVFAFQCAECDHMLANQYDEQISDDDEDRLLHEEVTCPKCGHKAKAKQIFECAKRVGIDDWEKGCDDPKSVDFGEGGFDVANFDFRIAWEKVGNYTKARITDFRPHDPSLLRDDISEPMDIDLFLSQMALDEQADMLNKKNPFPKEADKALQDFFIAKANEKDSDSEPWGDE